MQISSLDIFFFGLLLDFMEWFLIKYLNTMQSGFHSNKEWLTDAIDVVASSVAVDDENNSGIHSRDGKSN